MDKVHVSRFMPIFKNTAIFYWTAFFFSVHFSIKSQWTSTKIHNIQTDGDKMNREKKIRWICPPHSLNPSINGIFIFQFENWVEYHEFRRKLDFTDASFTLFFTAKKKIENIYWNIWDHVLAPHNHRIERNGSTPDHYHYLYTLFY